MVSMNVFLDFFLGVFSPVWEEYSFTVVDFSLISGGSKPRLGVL